MAALVPSALPATEGDVGTTCATEVRNPMWFPFHVVKVLLAWSPKCGSTCRLSALGDGGHERSGEASGSAAASYHCQTGPETWTICSEETAVQALHSQAYHAQDTNFQHSQQHLPWYLQELLNIMLSFHLFVFLSLLIFCPFLPQLRALSVKPGCGISVEAQPATGQIFAENFLSHSLL